MDIFRLRGISDEAKIAESKRKEEIEGIAYIAVTGQSLMIMIISISHLSPPPTKVTYNIFRLF